MMLIICFLAAWGFFLMVTWDCWTMVQNGITVAKRMHRVPCSKCQYFTNSSYLKCPVHPSIALTDEAANCLDYSPVETNSNYSWQDRGVKL